MATNTTNERGRDWVGTYQTYQTPVRHGACVGKKRERLYGIWLSMRKRCLSRRDRAFPRYGGRGIAIAAAWETFPAFREWSLAHGYDDNLSLDRIDNDGAYSPENCRWTDRKTQCRNTRANRIYTYRGKIACLAEHTESVGMPYFPVYQRLTLLGWSIERALETPIRGKDTPR